MPKRLPPTPQEHKEFLRSLGFVLKDFLHVRDDGKYAINPTWRSFAAERLPSMVPIVEEWLDHPAFSLIAAWAAEWARCGYPQVEVGHRLAASLMATTMDGESAASLRLPWRAFRIVLPSGLLSAHYDPAGPLLEWASAAVTSWGADRVHVVGMGAGDGYWTDRVRAMAELGEENRDAAGLGVPLEARDKRALAMLDRLLLGICAEMSAPERRQEAERRAKQASERSRAPGALLSAWTYVLRREVKVDCREVVRDYMNGAATRRPRVQTLVRGHWKRQHHGPEARLVKWIHLEAYWRGPEEGPIPGSAERGG